MYRKRGVTEVVDVNSGVSGLRTGRETHCPALLGFVVRWVFFFKNTFFSSSHSPDEVQFSIRCRLFK